MGAKVSPAASLDNVTLNDQLLARLGGGYSITDKAGVSAEDSPKRTASAPLKLHPLTPRVRRSVMTALPPKRRRKPRTDAKSKAANQREEVGAHPVPSMKRTRAESG